MTATRAPRPIPLSIHRDPREAKATCPKCVQRAQKIGLSEVEA